MAGSDSNAGTSPAAPFLTLQRCADAAHAAGGAVCLVAAGVYRETATLTATAAARGDPPAVALEGEGSGVVVSGLDVLQGLSWELAPGMPCTYRAALPAGTPRFEQLFHAGRMMVEARWPNIDVSTLEEQVLNRSAVWRPTGQGSVYGEIHDPALAEFGYSWDGALATLQVAHQFFTWTRNVSNHTKGGSSFSYPQDLPGLAEWGSGKHNWANNQYFLSGKLEALDAPGEWHSDGATLHLRPLGDAGGGAEGCPPPPADGSVEIKARDYAVATPTSPPGGCKAWSTVAVRGVNTHGSTLSLRCCLGCEVTNATLSFPTFDRDIPEMAPAGRAGNAAATRVDGTDNVVSDVVLRMSNNHGLGVSGANNTVRNVLVDRTDWLGTLTYVPLSVSGVGGAGAASRLVNSTVRYFGNAGVVTNIVNTPPAKQGHPQPPPEPMAGRDLEVAFCHIHHGGLIGKDSAALYTGGWAAAGLRWHHNWVHDASEKCVRADDQSRNMTVHHNVIFNCGEGAIQDSQSDVAGFGLVLKGNGHMAYANTVFSAMSSELCMPSCVERLKPFRPQFPREPQNFRSVVVNSVASKLSARCGCNATSAPGGNRTALFRGELPDLRLADPLGFDFRPLPASPLVGAGAVVPGIAPAPPGGGYPDIGAYQHGEARWAAGCAGLSGCDDPAL